MNKECATRVSKYLSLVLRHDPAAAGVTLDAEGWVDVEELLAGAARHGFAFTRDELEEVVQTSDKQRFALSHDGQRIRANQGHSIAVELNLKQETPPALLYHGTVERFLSSDAKDKVREGSKARRFDRRIYSVHRVHTRFAGCV